MWDLEIGDGTLWEHMGSTEFPARLADALDALRRGRSRSRWGGVHGLERCGNFETLVLAGGSVPDAPLRLSSEVTQLTLPDDRLGAALGVRQVLRRLLGPSSEPCVVDMGQSAIKAAGSGGTGCWERDCDVLPVRRPGVPDQDMQGRRWDPRDQRRGLIEFLGDCLGHALAKAPRVEPLVIALPCEVPTEAGGRLGESSYLGMPADPHWVTELVDAVSPQLDRAGCRSVWILNDAELAAFAAHTLDPTGHTLVVTLGFAIGGAVLEPLEESLWIGGFHGWG